MPKSLTIPRASIPSIRQGYARNASESKSPWLWRKLVGAWCPCLGHTGSFLYDATGRHPPAAINNCGWEIGPQGWQLTFITAQSPYVSIPVSVTSPLTMVVRGISPSETANTAICSVNDNTATHSQFVLVMPRLDPVEFGLRWDLSGLTWCQHFGHTANVSQTLVGLSKANDERRLYLNGSRGIDDTFDRATGECNTFDLGRFGDFSPGGYYTGSINASLLYDRALTDNEIQEVSDDILAPFRLKDQFAWVADRTDLGVERVTNRIIPVTTELYNSSQEEFSDLHIVKAIDSKYILQFTLTNKSLTYPYTVAASDVSGADRVEFIFKKDDIVRSRKAILATNGTDGVVTYKCGFQDLDIPGIWQVYTKVIYGDLTVSYPDVPFTVQ